ncbi:MAG TPA: radical SAM protein [Methanothrix sp.]|nr:radical SAM protein [Methanothrix sp.]
MTRVLLIYPYFKPRHDRSSFRFPPLGLGYLASSLESCGYMPELLDCTFLDREEAWQRATQSKVDIVGIYSMVSMLEDSLTFARLMRDRCDLLVAGGPLPSCSPETFHGDFDLVVVGEGEETIQEIVRAYEAGLDFRSINGLQYRHPQQGITIRTPKRDLLPHLDQIPFPARHLFQNEKYIDHSKRKYSYSATSVITTRGCPFSCEFCSNAVFGTTYRERSSENVLDEVEEVLALGYDRIHFADDVFTLNKKRMIQICEDIQARKLDFKWECLGRVDSIDVATAKAMKKSGCDRILFGIESGDESILKLMNKRISPNQARLAIETAREAGLKTGAFFILCYPGDTNDTVIKTIKFAASLPLDYLSFTMPYPLPGTMLSQRINGKGQSSPPIDNSLVYEREFSQAKMRFAILKGQIQFGIEKRSDSPLSLAKKPFEILTDNLFRMLK